MYPFRLGLGLGNEARLELEKARESLSLTILIKRNRSGPDWTWTGLDLTWTWLDLTGPDWTGPDLDRDLELDNTPAEVWIQGVLCLSVCLIFPSLQYAVYNIHSCPGSIVVCEDETYYYCLEASPSQRFASSAIILLVRLVYKCKIMSGLLEQS